MDELRDLSARLRTASKLWQSDSEAQEERDQDTSPLQLPRRIDWSPAAPQRTPASGRGAQGGASLLGVSQASTVVPPDLESCDFSPVTSATASPAAQQRSLVSPPPPSPRSWGPQRAPESDYSHALLSVIGIEHLPPIGTDARGRSSGSQPAGALSVRVKQRPPPSGAAAQQPPPARVQGVQVLGRRTRNSALYAGLRPAVIRVWAPAELTLELLNQRGQLLGEGRCRIRYPRALPRSLSAARSASPVAAGAGFELTVGLRGPPGLEGGEGQEEGKLARGTAEGHAGWARRELLIGTDGRQVVVAFTLRRPDDASSPPPASRCVRHCLRSCGRYGTES